MTPSHLRAALSRLGLGVNEAARLLGHRPRTVARWLSGARPIPAHVQDWLAEQEQGVPDKQGAPIKARFFRT